MGITIAYRGRLADLTRVEDLEDRLLDFALEVGGMAQIWRSHADDNPERVIRGVILNVAPGLEPTSMLLSPEGWLIGLVDIEDAERGRLTEPPWCFTKTQFGPLEGHVAVVELLTAVRREFIPDLEVSDEGGYYETHEVAELSRRRAFLQSAIDGLAEGLERHALTREGAEDPEILIRRIERIAVQVHRTLQRPPEHPPVTGSDEVPGVPPDPDATEALWDEMFKHNRRQQERMQRSLGEAEARGEDHESAFENAMDDLALNIPGDDADSDEEPGDLPDSFAADADELTPTAADEEDDPFTAAEDRHPLLESAMDFLKDLHTIFKDTDSKFEPSLRTLFQGAGDAMGGLAQALSGRGDEEDDLDTYGLHVVQLKRALRGAAFARAALFSLRPAVTAEQYQELHRTTQDLEKGIFAELSRLRSEYRARDS